MIRWDSPCKTEGEKVIAACHEGSSVVTGKFEGEGKAKNTAGMLPALGSICCGRNT